VVRAEPLRFSEAGVREVVRTVLLPLRTRGRSSCSTRTSTAGTRAGGATAPPAERGGPGARPLDALGAAVAGRDINTQMEGYYLYKVVPPMLGFIDDLTNWYIRRSAAASGRRDDSTDKARRTRRCTRSSTTFSKVLAPFLPFAAESLYQSLVVATGSAAVGADGAPLDSVHLTDWPRVDPSRIDRALEAAVHATRDVVSLGRRLRERTRLKTRQPLRRLTVVHHDDAVRDAVTAHAALVRDELNVRAVEVRADGHELATVTCKANFKTLGKRRAPARGGSRATRSTSSIRCARTRASRSRIGSGSPGNARTPPSRRRCASMRR
jgi:isoleucyl-tRNA synthetase